MQSLPGLGNKSLFTESGAHDEDSRLADIK